MTRFVQAASIGCRISDGRPPPNLPHEWGEESGRHDPEGWRIDREENADGTHTTLSSRHCEERQRQRNRMGAIQGEYTMNAPWIASPASRDAGSQ
jgi:hypothetical protein